MIEVEQLTDSCAHHGEGPVWHPAWGGLRWVDMLAGDVLTLDADSAKPDRKHVGDVVAALRPRAGGGAVLALERGFALADDELTDIRPLGQLWSDTRIRMNEGGCSPQGSFYCGSMAYDATTGAGVLYRLDSAGRVGVVLEGVTISNGLAWSPDGTVAYYVDTATGRIDAFDHHEDSLTRRRTLVRIDPEHGAPDGLTVDAEGGLWVAMWGGGAVHHYTPAGELADVVRLPVPRVTACTFGGDDLDELYITTSRVDTDLAEYPEAGAVFRIPRTVRGTLPRVYRG